MKHSLPGWRVFGLIVAAAIGTALATMFAGSDAGAQVDPTEHLPSLYDTSAPGVTSNVTERFCVVNRSPYETFNADYWQLVILAWLNEPAGWEAIGTNKVDFVSSCDPGTDPVQKCQTVQICIEGWDQASWPCGGAAACAGFDYGPVQAVDSHGHDSSKKILIAVDLALIRPDLNDWRCQGVTCVPDHWDDKQRTITHEMGHLMGEHGNHGGPEFGVAGGGDGPWDGAWLYNPTPGEIDRFRAHLDGEPARPVSQCVGFPQTDRVLVSWFDAAEDETQHRAELDRIGDDPPNGNVLNMEQGEAAGFGSRVTFLSEPRSDVTDPGGAVVWIVDPQVYGGPRNQWNSNTNLTYSFASGLAWPSRPCTLEVEATGPLGQIQLTWVDASYDETEFAVYYQYPDRPDGWQRLDDDGWTGAGTVPAGSEAFADSAADNQFLEYGKRVCAKVVALRSAQVSFDSNYACVTIPNDWDGDGFPDDEDWCPGTATQSPGAPGDDDCDGFITTIEDFVGTDPNDPCANTATAGDEADDKWPLDMNDDQWVTTFDTIPYIGILNSPAPGPPYTVRLDLNMDQWINTFDLIPFIGMLNTPCDL